MNLSRKNRTEGKKRAKKGRTVKSSYAGYDSCSQTMDLKVSVKPISDYPPNIQIFKGNKQSLAVDQECKQRHSAIVNRQSSLEPRVLVELKERRSIRDRPVSFDSLRTWTITLDVSLNSRDTTTFELTKLPS